MTEEITKAIRNAFNEYLNAVDKIILENQALQIEFQHLKQENNSLEAELQNITVQSNNEITALKQENERLLEQKNGVMATNIKYFMTLEEIMLIINELKQQYDYMSDYNEIKEIETKINEVLGND